MELIFNNYEYKYNYFKIINILYKFLISNFFIYVIIKSKYIKLKKIR